MPNKKVGRWVGSVVGFASLALTLPASAAASESDSVTVTQLMPSSSAFVLNVSAARTNLPSCATSPNTWVIDDTTPQGQEMAAVIIAAFAASQQVTIYGTGACPSSVSNTEQVLSIVVSGGSS